MDRRVQFSQPSHGSASKTPGTAPGPLMKFFDSPIGCFLRWSTTAALLLIIAVFVGQVRSQMQKISDRGGVRLTGSERTSRNFLMVLLVFIIALEVLSIYKMIECFL